MGLTADYLDLYPTQQLLAVFEGQPDLLWGQIGDGACDRADVLGNWLDTVRRQLNPDRPLHGVALRCHRGHDNTPPPPHTFHSH
jgi:hypothetical protein